MRSADTETGMAGSSSYAEGAVWAKWLDSNDARAAELRKVIRGNARAKALLEELRVLPTMDDVRELAELALNMGLEEKGSGHRTDRDHLGLDEARCRSRVPRIAPSPS